jgi:hypothetical protein
MYLALPILGNINVKKAKVIALHAVKAFRGSSSVASLILNLDTRLR